MRNTQSPKHAVCLLVVVLAAFMSTACGRAASHPLVVLVSLDGWRWDYIDRASAPNLRALAARGVRASSLIPSFPPKTFPNHYTLVTGLYPEHHGIVANVMIEPGFPERFTMSAETAKDSRWWGGEPVWVTAIRQGQRSASMFWPGSEALIGGVRPTYWRPFDDAVPNEDRVRQVIDWLALPAHAQPSFVTVYFSEVDTAGHRSGPDSPQVMEAAAHLDQALGDLIAGVGRLELLDRTTFVVVSDHGMSQLSDERRIFLDDYLDLSTVSITEWSPNLGLTPRSRSVDDVYSALKGKHPALDIYRKQETPSHLHYRDNPRIPPIVGLAHDGWTITSHARVEEDREKGRRNDLGAHGFDPTTQPMHGVLVAAGPGLRHGVVVPSLENVHVYEFLCDLLGLKPAPNDGSRVATQAFFQK
ncbi:MAG: ectonucleotide pyrophosphatase/phosphodiesterase [Vicinamibacterales bacterium]